MKNHKRNSFEEELLDLVQMRWKSYEDKLSELKTRLETVSAVSERSMKQCNEILAGLEKLSNYYTEVTANQRQMSQDIAILKSQVQALRQGQARLDQTEQRLTRVETSLNEVAGTPGASSNSVLQELQRLQTSLRSSIGQLNGLAKR